jgi:hypothetical protein
MSHRKQKPQWWQVYVGLAVLVGLFLPEMQARLTEPEHIIAEIGILFLIFAFMQYWLRANRSALMDYDPDEENSGIKLYQIPPMQLDGIEESRPVGPTRQMVETPVSEIKGVLGDTFEWDSSEENASVFGAPRGLARRE